MARIVGVVLPEGKRVDIGLTAIHGVGRNLAKEILLKADVDPAKRVKELSSEEITRLQKAVDQYLVEGALRQKVSDGVKRLKSIGAYRGMRHQAGLPVRGQRTRSNARTKRGRRRTVGALRKKDLAKTSAATKEKKEEK
jgi:small subunit ribosomal protein S13